MDELSFDARVIVNILRNTHPRSSGFLPLADFKVLFEREPKSLHEAVNELVRRGFVMRNDNGEIGFTALGSKKLCPTRAPVPS
jgi:hypothetical protein